MATGIAEIDGAVQAATDADTAMDGAIIVLNTFQSRLDAGIQAALAGGATKTQLADLIQSSADLTAKKTALAAAVATVPPNVTPAAFLAKKK
jgi:hypothetical protein